MHTTTKPASSSKANPYPALVACALWLYLGLVGVVLLACGVADLVDGAMSGSAALLLCVSGALLAAASWQRGWSVLDRAAVAADVAMEAFTAGAQVTRLGHTVRFPAVRSADSET